MKNSVNGSMTKSLLKNIYEKGFFHLLSSNFFINLMLLGSHLMVVWILVPEDIGRIKILQSYCNFAALFAGMGLNVAVLKLCSEYREEKEKHYIFTTAIKYTGCFLTTSYLLFSLLSFFDVYSEDPVINRLVPLFFLILIPATLNSVVMNYLQALKRIREMAGIQAATKTISIIFILVFSYLMHLQGYIFGLASGLFITSFFLFRHVKALQFSPTAPELSHPFKNLWPHAKYSFLANLLDHLGTYIDVYLINFLVQDRKMVGYYCLAHTMVIGLRIVTSTINTICIPYFSEKSHDIKAFMKIFHRYERLSGFLSIVLLCVCLLAGPELIHMIFRSKYDEAIVFFQILAGSWALRHLYSFKGAAIFGLGRIDLNFTGGVIALPINTLITWIFLTRMGIIGAAVGAFCANLVSYIVSTAMLEIAMVRKSAESTRTS